MQVFDHIWEEHLKISKMPEFGSEMQKIKSCKVFKFFVIFVLRTEKVTILAAENDNRNIIETYYKTCKLCRTTFPYFMTFCF